MADFEESYLVKGSALARIGRVTREVETNLGLKPPEHRRKRIPATILEGVFTETLAPTSDPNAPTTAKFQIKTAVMATDGWEDEDAPSIIPVLNRTRNEYAIGDIATVIELYANKYFVISGAANGAMNLLKGIVVYQHGCGYYDIEVSEWNGETPSGEVLSASSSASVNECDICSVINEDSNGSGSAANCEDDVVLPEFEEGGAPERIVTRQTTETGTVVLGFDPASLFVPLAMWSDCYMIYSGDENAKLDGSSSSSSSGEMEPVFNILRGFQEHIVEYKDTKECCPTTGEWKLIKRKAVIFAGVQCAEQTCGECPEE